MFTESSSTNLASKTEATSLLHKQAQPPQVQVQTINAFIDNNRGGNPAGLVLDADTLSTQQKQAIAHKVGLSETAFVSSSRVATYKLEFFTPNRQIAHCGHATIATFSYLRQIGRIGEGAYTKETIEGNRDIYIEGEQAFMQQLAPSYVSIDSQLDEVRESLGLSDDSLFEASPTIVNTGVNFLVVPLKNEADVRRVTPNIQLISKISETYDLIGYYVFSIETKESNRDAGARMFAPRYGIDEESATGMAAGPLACVLFDILNIKKDKFLIEQGHLMTPSSPSLITVRLTLDNNKIITLMAGGKAKIEKTITVNF